MPTAAAIRAANLAKFRAAISAAPAGPREPNGRPSRRVVDVAEREFNNAEEAKSVVIEARMRHHGLSREDAGRNEAGSPNAGSVHGRMRLAGIRAELGHLPATEPGMLTQPQWLAAEYYISRRLNWLGAIDAPGRHIEHPGITTGEGGDQWREEAVKLWKRIMACLQEASTSNRSPVIAALDHFLARGLHSAHMEGDLRIGLNAIHKQFIEGGRK